MTDRLRSALEWWRNVLGLDIVEEHSWTPPSSDVVHLFVDARGQPPHCAAVLFANGQIQYTAGAPPKSLLDKLVRRCDEQIMALEILAITIGLATFAGDLCGRKVVVWSDNKGAEVCLAPPLAALTLARGGQRAQGSKMQCVQGAARKGAARAADHNMLIHEIWTQVRQSVGASTPGGSRV